jgi:hypothetical protein
MLDRGGKAQRAWDESGVFTMLGGDIDLDSGVSARVEDLSGVDLGDRHGVCRRKKSWTWWLREDSEEEEEGKGGASERGF